MNTGIHIGASKEAIAEAKDAILAILASNADQKTLRKALAVLESSCSVSNVNMSNLNLQGDTTHTHTHYAGPEPEAPPYAEDDGFDIAEEGL